METATRAGPWAALVLGHLIGAHLVRGPDPLPILMDDVLVNFDPTRATAAASGILQMAESRQILFFTCHPTMVDTFRNQAPKIPVYEIAGADIRPSAST